MKNSYKLAGAALLAAVGVGLTVPTVTKADPNVTSNGKVEFTQESDTDITIVIPDSSSQVPITEPPANEDGGPLKIRAVTDLDFDTHEILSNESQSTKVYYAKPFATTVVGTGEAVQTSHFVAFQDIRQDTDTNYHEISAKITKQFTAPASGTSAERTLDGATITYKNASIVTATNPSTKPLDSSIQDTLTIDANDSALIYKNITPGLGYGKFNLVFGPSGTLTDEQAKAYDSVQLEIPGKNVVKTGEYVAEITWSIGDTK